MKPESWLQQDHTKHSMSANRIDESNKIQPVQITHEQRRQDAISKHVQAPNAATMQQAEVLNNHKVPKYMLASY
jgi:hypothetical protein